MVRKVTVGVPVYNGAPTLRRAVESVLLQTHSDCIIHISDNASTDGTAEVGGALAAEHDRVVFSRQHTSLGAVGNFRFVLEQAKTEFFMWLAADDYLLPTYVERTLAALEADPTLVACATRVRFVSEDGTQRISIGTAPLLSDKISNLSTYLLGPKDNARIYSLYRAEAVRKVIPQKEFHGWDLAFTAGTLLYGKYDEIPDVLMIRDLTPHWSYVKAVRSDNQSKISWLFPLLPMTRDILVRQKIPWRARIIMAILGLNISHHINYVKFFHPRYAKIASPVLGKVLACCACIVHVRLRKLPSR